MQIVFGRLGLGGAALQSLTLPPPYTILGFPETAARWKELSVYTTLVITTYI